MRIRCHLMLGVIGGLCGITPLSGSAQPPSALSGNGWLRDASHAFLNTYQARGRFQGRPFAARLAIFGKVETCAAASKTGKEMRRDYDVYQLYLLAGSALSEEDAVSVAFGAKALSDRFEIRFYVQPGRKISHRTITVSADGVMSGVAFPGASEFLDRSSPPVQAVLVPRGADASEAVILDEAHDFTLRLRIDTVTDKIQQGSLYLCVNDDKKTFVEGRFTAHASDALSRQRVVQRTRALGDAIRSGNAAKLRTLLEEGGDPNTKLYSDPDQARMGGEFGYDTLLAAAVIRGETDCIKTLLDAGADINLPNSARLTPLMFPALNGNLKMADYLLTHGADPRAAGPAGQTALHLAVRRAGSLEVCKRLLAAGADINAVDERGSTPLIEAVHAEKLDIARWLLDHHADVDAKDKQGHTAFYYAATDAARVMLVQAGAKP